MNTLSNILVLGLTNKTGLAIARNLNKNACTVDAVYFTDVAARYSKHIRKSYDLGNPEQDVVAFVSKLINLLNSQKYDALIPVNDAALEICRLNKVLLSKQVRIVGLNADESYCFSIDKSTLLNLGREIGLSVPKGFLISNLTDYTELNKENLLFPLVAKPVSSAKIHNNKLLSFSVKICANELQLHDFVRENVNCTAILIQEFVVGYGIGYNFIADQGEILNAYVHKRVNEYQGVSTLRESLPASTYGLSEKMTELVARMNWSGVGMVEFKVSPDGTLYLMEFNGRFFGSTELSVKCGINLPHLFLQRFILDSPVEKNKTPKHVFVRFLHDEVMLYSSYLFKLQFKKYFSWLFGYYKSLFSASHYIEDALMRDPKFTLAMYWYDVKRWRKKFAAESTSVAIRKLRKEDLQEKKRIIFVCYGNICRSPFAQLLAEKSGSDFTFSSVGMFCQEDRMSPVNAVSAARSFDVEMDEHRSKALHSIDWDTSDVFVVMDKKNHRALTEYGISKDNIFFLGAAEIHDPYGKSEKEFEKIYEEIKINIHHLFTA